MPGKACIFLCLLFAVPAAGQNNAVLSDFLNRLYQSFPLDSSENYIKEYIKDHPEYAAEYSKTDSATWSIRRKADLDEILKYPPYSASMRYYFHSETFRDTSLSHMEFADLDLIYTGDTLWRRLNKKEMKRCERQYNLLEMELTGLTGIHRKYTTLVSCEYPSEGKGCDIFSGPNDKHPIINIEFFPPYKISIWYMKYFPK
jgi:hypothetical protein